MQVAHSVRVAGDLRQSCIFVASNNNVSEKSIKHISLKLIISLAAIALLASILLACYGFVIRAQEESLLKDVTALRVGESTEADAFHFFEKHKRLCSNRMCQQDYCVTSFKLTNRWLEALRLEPHADFYVGYTVKNGKVSAIHASLLRAMPIYPTFPASAGVVEEYLENPSYLVGGQGHYAFPTPVGKPYLVVNLDSHATPIQREHAFAFSFRCFVKPGRGCNLPCDYLPLAWQDWKADLHNSSFPMDYFNNAYPNNARCQQ
jgi:hypothetical protein